jgi:hypothetical protein
MYTIQIESRRKQKLLISICPYKSNTYKGLGTDTTLKHYIFTEIDVGWVWFWCQSLTRDF